MKSSAFTLLSSFFYLIILSNSYCQNYFSRRYDLNNQAGWDFSVNLVWSGDYYILQSEGQIPENPEHRRLAFLKIDTSGDPIGQYIIYTDPFNSIGTGEAGCFIKLQKTAGYALAGYKSVYVANGRYDRGWLIRFNDNLDTLWSRIYTDTYPHDSSFMIDNFRELSNTGFIITSTYTNVEGNTFWRIRLFKTDSSGNLLWDKYYGNGNTYFISCDVIPTSDGGYAISGGAFPYNTTAQDNDPIIIKTDSIGNQEWIKNFGNPVCGEAPAFVDKTLDGYILAGSTFSDSCSDWDTYWDRINLIKLNNDGSVIWDRKYGLAKYWLKLKKVKSLEDGCIVAVGAYYIALEGYRLKVSWILKTDSEGNELWYREYKMMVGDHGENSLYNIIQTGDHGFAACGSVFPVNPPDTGTQDSWVIKVDSLGCTAPDECWVGQKEIEVREFTPDKPFVFYPNPANEKLTIEFHENPLGAEIELYDLTGRKAVSDKIVPNKPLIEMDVGKFPPGLYILKVTIPGIRPVMGKVVVD